MRDKKRRRLLDAGQALAESVVRHSRLMADSSPTSLMQDLERAGYDLIAAIDSYVSAQADATSTTWPLSTLAALTEDEDEEVTALEPGDVALSVHLRSALVLPADSPMLTPSAELNEDSTGQDRLIAILREIADERGWSTVAQWPELEHQLTAVGVNFDDELPSADAPVERLLELGQSLSYGEVTVDIYDDE